MNMDIWVNGTLNQLFIRGSYSEIHFEKLHSGKTPFSIGSFVIPILFLLAVNRVAFYQNATFLIVVLTTKKWYFSFLKKLFLSEICFEVKVLKMLKVSCDCHIKICQSLKRRAILKIPSIVI